LQEPFFAAQKNFIEQERKVKRAYRALGADW
jgi:hypothetical protein